MQNKTVGGYLQDADSLRKAVVEEMREAPQKDPNDDRRSVYDAKTWGQMCDQFESDGVWADHHMLHFAPQVLGMRIEIMPALPGSDHFQFTQGLTEEQQKMCIVGWLNNSHYTRTVPMDGTVQIRAPGHLQTGACRGPRLASCTNPGTETNSTKMGWSYLRPSQG